MTRFLADESCPLPIVHTLRAAGYDVAAIAESSPGASDDRVIGQAVQEARILITEDTDFGELVYAHAQPSGGVVLLRFPAGVRSRIASELLRLIEDQGDRLVGAFVVLQPGRARIGRRTQ